MRQPIRLELTDNTEEISKVDEGLCCIWGWTLNILSDCCKYEFVAFSDV